MLAKRSNAWLNEEYITCLALPFASIIPCLWPCARSLSLEHQIKAVSPVFTTTPYFTFTYQKITSLFVVWTRKIQIPYILFPVMEKWTARHGIAGTPCCLHTCPVSSPWFPRHARSPRQDPFVSTCHVSRVSLPRVCLCDCLSVSTVICWSSYIGFWVDLCTLIQSVLRI